MCWSSWWCWSHHLDFACVYCLNICGIPFGLAVFKRNLRSLLVLVSGLGKGFHLVSAVCFAIRCRRKDLWWRGSGSLTSQFHLLVSVSVVFSGLLLLQVWFFLLLFVVSFFVCLGQILILAGLLFKILLLFVICLNLFISLKKFTGLHWLTITLVSFQEIFTYFFSKFNLYEPTLLNKLLYLFQSSKLMLKHELMVAPDLV